MVLPEQTYNNPGLDCNHKQAFIWMLDFKKNQSLVVSKLGMVAHLRSREESKVVSGCTVSLRPAWPAGNPVSKTEQKNHNCIKIVTQKGTFLISLMRKT